MALASPRIRFCGFGLWRSRPEGKSSQRTPHDEKCPGQLGQANQGKVLTNT
jgi:hypothetical protein